MRQVFQAKGHPSALGSLLDDPDLLHHLATHTRLAHATRVYCCPAPEDPLRQGRGGVEKIRVVEHRVGRTLADSGILACSGSPRPPQCGTSQPHTLNGQPSCRVDVDRGHPGRRGNKRIRIGGACAFCVERGTRNRQRAVTAGVVIQTAVPLRFANGLDASRFECIERSGRTIRWHAITDAGTRFSCRFGAQVG